MARHTRHDARYSPGHPSRTLSIAASGTALVMAVFAAFVVNVGDSVRTFHAGVAGEAWGLSGMSLGLAAALLTAGALADDLGHRRVLRCSAGLLAAASAARRARTEHGDTRRGSSAARRGRWWHPGRRPRLDRPRVSLRSRRAHTRRPSGGQPWARESRSARSPVRDWRRRSAGAAGFWVEAAAAAALTTAAATLTESRTTAKVRLDLAGDHDARRGDDAPDRRARRDSPRLVRHHHARPLLRRDADARGVRRRRAALTPPDARPASAWPAAVPRLDQRRAVHRSCRRRVDELRAGADAAVPAHQRDRQRGRAGRMVSHQHGRRARRRLTAQPATSADAAAHRARPGRRR